MRIAAKNGVVLIMMIIMIFSACASKEEPTQKSGPPERKDIPDFFLNPPTPDDQFVGLGLAKLKNDSLSRDTAIARARADIAKQVSVSVQTMLTDYAQEAGAENDTQTITFIEKTSKEVANIQLNGATTKKQYAAKDGTWYVMVYFPKAAMLQDVSDVFTRNENAAFAEFKARQAIERLNMEMEANPPKSAGIDSPVNQE